MPQYAVYEPNIITFVTAFFIIGSIISLKTKNLQLYYPGTLSTIISYITASVT